MTDPTGITSAAAAAAGGAILKTAGEELIKEIRESTKHKRDTVDKSWFKILHKTTKTEAELGQMLLYQWGMLGAMDQTVSELRQDIHNLERENSELHSLAGGFRNRLDAEQQSKANFRSELERQWKDDLALHVQNWHLDGDDPTQKPSTPRRARKVKAQPPIQSASD